MNPGKPVPEENKHLLMLTAKELLDEGSAEWEGAKRIDAKLKGHFRGRRVKFHLKAAELRITLVCNWRLDVWDPIDPQGDYVLGATFDDDLSSRVILALYSPYSRKNLDVDNVRALLQRMEELARSVENAAEKPPACICLDREAGNVDYTHFKKVDLGMDKHYGEVSVRRCKLCGRHWLHYYYVLEAFSNSGRWYTGIISPETAETVSAENALDILSMLDSYYCGGSYYEGKVSKSKGRPRIY